jgi:N-hydroxyarylamine O-acetyltransferase
MSGMDVQAYLDRIGYAGVPRVDLATLTELHRRHLRAIPYESLDVLLGAPPGLDPAAAYDKIVRRGRGTCCCASISTGPTSPTPGSATA